MVLESALVSFFYKWLTNFPSTTCTTLLFYAEYIMRNAGLDEAQAGIEIAGRNISILL